MWIAAFGSLLTRNHLTTAIQSASAVAKAVQDKNEARLKSAYEQWKVDSENALKMANFQREAYNSSLAKMRTDATTGQAEMRTQWDAYKDEVAQHIHAVEGWEGIKKLMFARGKQTAAMASGVQAFNEHIDNQQKIAEGLASDDPDKQAEALTLYANTLDKVAGAKKGTVGEQLQVTGVGVRLKSIANDLRSGDPAKVEAAQKLAASMPEIGPGVLKAPAAQKAAPAGSTLAERQTRFDEAKKEMRENNTYVNDALVWDRVNHEMYISKQPSFSPGVADMISDQIIAGNYAAASGFGRSPNLLAQLDASLLKRMKEHDPPLTGADIARIKIDYAAYAQGMKAFEAGGKLEPVVRYLNVATAHLGTLEQAATALASGDSRVLNSLQNAFETQFGAAGPITFDAIKGIVAAEIEKAVSGSAGAVSDREDLKANLNRSNSPEQLASVVRGYEALMAGQIGGLRQSYDRTERLAGQPAGKFDERFLSPQTQAIVSNKVAGAGGPKENDRGDIKKRQANNLQEWTLGV